MTVYALDGVRPTLPDDDDFWIAPTASVIGDVHLESGASIWFGAVLRGDTEVLRIGSGTNIQENTVVHSDPGFPVEIGADCTIGHKAMIHGCSIGDGTLVGMGATILNGARIGRGCLIGAGALVTEGKEIPDGSMVIGMPGRVLRELSEDAMEMNVASAARYRKRMRQFKAGLVQVPER